MHYPVTVLGYGTRIGIWFQGCSIGCRGCVSRDTWASGAGVEASVEDVIATCDAWAGQAQLDGITISGGEPFDQPRGLVRLLYALDGWLGGRRESVDVLCYSGYPEHRLRARYPEILAELDAVIPEPYVARRAPGGRWRGSNNQTVVPLTPLGRDRYADISPRTPESPEIQFVVDDDIWFIGIPRPGDMDAIEANLRQRGILVTATSWR